MKIIEPSAVIENATPRLQETIEAAGRTCWKSEDKIEEGSAALFIQKIKNFKHESVLEHGSITVRFIVDRGVSHELVRHRLSSFSQESTRYCNYAAGKYGNEITVIRPCFWDEDSFEYRTWKDACLAAEDYYIALMKSEGCSSAQQARSVLPNSLKTEVVMTCNPRQWRNIFHLRCDRAAHPQMREVMLPLFKEFCKHWPAIFSDVEFTR